ncbi:MAG: glycosyltransferase family 2 protein [Erysipelotrichales bacterium]
MSKLVSVIIPCYNEEENISNLYNELIEKLNKSVSYEFLFVDDGSKDKTTNEVQTLGEEDKRVKLIDFSRNFGKEAAMLAGLDYAAGDAAVIIDADLQMPVATINDLIKLWQEGNKLVLTYKTRRKKGLKSKLATKYYDVFNNISDTQIQNDALDFQIMDREVINTICSMRERTRFFKGITGYIGYDFKIIPVDISERTAGESSFSSSKTLFSYAFKSIALYSDLPLKFSIIIGGITAFISFLYLIFIVFNTLINGIGVPGYASTLAIMMFLFSIVLIILGVMGYYISLIYNEVKQRPNYIVNETKNIEEE